MATSMESRLSPAEQVDKQVDDMVVRLAGQHPEVDVEVIRRRANVERGEFADARVHLYVPIFVERAVRAWLAA